MFTDERPEHTRYIIQLQKREVTDMYEFEGVFNISDLDSSFATEISDSDGKKLHKTMGAAFTRVCLKITATIGSVEDRKGEQILRSFVAEFCPNKESNVVCVDKQK
jgi:hypothetical protein